MASTQQNSKPLALTPERIADYTPEVFAENIARIEQLAVEVAHADPSRDYRALHRAFNTASGSMRLDIDGILNHGYEVPSALESDQFEDWLIGRAALFVVGMEHVRRIFDNG